MKRLAYRALWAWAVFGWVVVIPYFLLTIGGPA